MGSLSSTSKLFQPLEVGSMMLKHRVIMAPLTRFRAEDDHTQNSLAIEYYAQRASVPGTLLISEAAFISPRACGYKNVPGIWNEKQIMAWKKVTDTVHEKGSYIVLQLWALGRAADLKHLEEDGYGCDVVSSSALPIPDSPLAPPRELTKEEIHEFIKDYAQAAKNAIVAGFDGVEIHGANGYLVDQFTQDTCNQRRDEWGGSIKNRARFGLEVARACVAAVGEKRVGFRLSPWSHFQGMRMEDPIPQFTYLLRGLKKLSLCYIHLVESRIYDDGDTELSDKLDPFIEVWGKSSPILVAGGYTSESARKTVDENFSDREIGVVFGRYFISNPDLPFRLENNLSLTAYDRNTFYKPRSELGYTDYRFSAEFGTKVM